jgi:acetyl-CoA carboxylase biotin carboxyl carrier protein
VSADPKSNPPRPFDATTIEHLIDLMSRHDLSEISLAEGDHRIRLRKGGAVVTTAVPAPVAHAVAPAAAPPGPAAEPAKPASKLLEIKSPMVGTFYSKPSPDKPDFVTVGSKVVPGTVVCMLGAMKIYDNITADVTGTVAEVCVKNDTAVDFGTVLFRVDPS